MKSYKIIKKEAELKLKNQNKENAPDISGEILKLFVDKPIYLETSVVDNLRWYQKFGFEIIKTIDLDYNLYVLKKD